MKSLIRFAGRLHRSEQGAEGAEKLLIIAAIVLPLLGFLIYMRDWIKTWMTGEATTVKTDADNFQNTGLN
jgi:hypothetical protein